MIIRHRTFLLAALFLAAIFLLAGCSAPIETVQTPAVDTPAAVDATTTPTPEPTPTAEPFKVILSAPASVAPQQAQAAEELLRELSDAQGWLVETRADLTAADLTAGVKVVLLLSRPANLEELLAAAPGTQFVLVSPVELQLPANLSIIHAQPAQQAFMAGYIAMLATSDWRAAALLPADEPLGAIVQDGFLNGGRYWCGRCAPLYPPAVNFPLFTSLPAGSPPANWAAAVDELQRSVLDVVYVAPEASSPELLANLVARGYKLVGGLPPAPEFKAAWVATVSLDPLPVLRDLWPDLAAGNGGQTRAARVQINDVNPTNLSDGRMRLVDETRAMLESGLLSAASIPLQ